METSKARRPSPVIPTIDIVHGRTVEPSGIQGLADPTDPIEIISHYGRQGAQRVFLDVQDSWDEWAASADVIRRADEIDVSVWITVADGFVPSLAHLESLLELGADAVGLSTTSVERPSMLHTAVQRYGSSRVVGVMNVQRVGDGRWNVVIQGDETETPLDAITWARMLADFGASHILPNSLDQEGTGRGYDLELVRAMADAVSVPVIASGGCGTLEHLRDGLRSGAAYVLMQKMLHDGSYSVADANSYVRQAIEPNDDDFHRTSSRAR
ncbi:HisA/HisF-related TIM barrel protein [Actinomadura terrae]|uniref:HisA/HisF-related TIM barrel protein n=1 Tax=Actinomadura terrae TaxID=604353 RepID=UPI001FA6DB97|nr:HisA/HisF-related TIM barrel protein [Actinomadura terrae]